VEPEVRLHNEISLKLGLEVSSLVASVKTATGSQAYQIGTRNISTSLRLRDGETQVLAGLISDADRSDANRVPLLGDVPLLGRLFSSQKDDRQKTEIVMSITPHLIRNIQRRSPAAEAFWSGTEATLRTKPVQIDTLPAETAAGAVKNAAAPMSTAAPSAPVDTSGLQLSWKGPHQAKVGQPIVLELALETKHQLRAAPLQVAYNPVAFEVMSVQAGDYFARAGAGQFSQAVDKASGRVSVGLAAADQKGASGAGTLVRIELRPLAAVAHAEIALIGLTPVGASQALSIPLLPVVTGVTIEP
jgi:general secretion pathway protein D